MQTWDHRSYSQYIGTDKEMSRKPRYSIITAIRNQRDANELFIESLKKYSSLPFELIIVDNASTDGSPELFEKAGATVIRNTKNYSYPYSQNQGIRAATSDLFFFLNNDLILSKEWDLRSVEIIENKNLEVFSWATTDRTETNTSTKKIIRRWKRIKSIISFILGINKKTLRWMTSLMYGEWEAYTNNRYEKFKNTCIENFSGSAVGMTRKAFEKVGYWDERIQSADFDLFLRVKERQKNQKDLGPIQLMLGVYLHHFQRLSFKNAPVAPFADAQNIINLEKKWDATFISNSLADLKT